MADDVWGNTSGGDWNTAADWSSGAVPDGTSDAAAISMPGTYTISISEGESELVGSVALSDPDATLDVASGGTLALGGADPLLTLAAGTIELEGTIEGATIAGSGGSILGNGGTLLDDQIMGDVVVLNDTYGLHVDGGLSGGGTLDLSASAVQLISDQSETFDNATILLGSNAEIDAGGYTYDATSGQYVGETLTFGPDFVLAQSSAAYSYVEASYFGAAIVNEGTIDADGTFLQISPTDFINSGTVVVGGTTTLDLYGSFTNTGAVTIEAGGTLEIAGDESVASLGAIDNGGVLDIAGTLDAGGGTIDVAPGTMFGTIELSGTIENAVIDGDGGTFIAAGGALLDDTVVGDLVVSYDGGLSVYGGLSGGGTIDLSATNDTLYAATTETFDDTTAVLGSGSEIIETSYTYDATSGTYLGGTLTLGPNFVVDQGASAYSYLYGEDGGATIVNDGTINADGSSLAIEPGTFVNAGTITVGGTSTLAIYGTFTNTGSITIDAGGTLEIAGTTDLASLASIENAGVLDIYYGGTLDAGGGTIDVGSSTVFSTLELSGVIENAAIEVTGSSFIAAGGTLDNDQIVGDVAVSNEYSSLTVEGGLSGGGTLDLSGYDGAVYALQSETFDNATLLLGSSDSLQVDAYTYDATSGQDLGGTLTLGPDFVVTEGTSTYGYLEGSVTGNEIINEGTIEADGTYTQVSPSEFVNAGTIEVASGETLEISSSFTNTGLLTIGTGATLEIAYTTDLASLASISNAGVLYVYYGGTLDAGGGTIDISPTTAFATLELSGTIENATLKGDGGSFILAGGTLQNDQIAGDLVVTNTYNSVNVLGGLSGGGTLDLSATNDSIYAVETETFDQATMLLGNGSDLVETGYSYDATSGTYLGQTLTFGPDFTLGQGTGTNSYVYGDYTGAEIINEGTIDADGGYTQFSPTVFVNTGTITVGGTDTFQVQGSFTNTGSITIDAGGTLEMEGTTDLASLASISNQGLLYLDYGTLDAGGGTIDIAAATAFASLELSGTIENATLLGAGGTFIDANGTLDDDQVAGDVAISNNYAGLAVLGGLSGGGTLDLSPAYGVTVYAAQSETFDNATLLLGNGDAMQVSATTYDATSGQYLGGTLTLGADFTVTQAAGASSYLQVDYTGATIVNEGTIDADGAYTQFTLTDFVNAGTITVGGTDTLETYGTFINTGSISIDAGGVLKISGLATLSSLGSISNAGTLDINGTLDGGGGTIDIAPTTGFATVELQGTIENATIEGAGGNFIIAGGTLENDQITGDLVVTDAYNNLAVGGGLSGGGTLDMSATNDSIYVVQAETFGDATLVLGNGGALIESGYTYDATTSQNVGGTLTLGPDFVLGQGAGANSYLDGYYTGAAIVNEGTIDADGTYTQVSPTNFVNTGTITVGGTDTLQIYGSFANTGAITIDAGGTLEISGTTDLGSLASIHDSGVLYIDNGTLVGGGGTIDIAPTTAFATLELSGTIENATLLGADGSFVIANGTLDGDQIAGDVTAANNYAGLAVLGGLSGGGTLDLSATNDTIYADETETFDDTTLILGSGSELDVAAYTYDATSQQDLGGTLTLGPDFVVTQGAGDNSYLEGSYTGAAIVNEGTIDAVGNYTQLSPTDFVNAGTIVVGGTDTLRVYGTFSNTGIVESVAGTGALVQFESADGLQGGTLTGGTYAALDGSALTLALGGLPTTLAATVELDGNGAAIGIVDPSNNATDDLGAVLTTIGAGGRLVLSNGATLATDGLTVAAGGTIFGAGTITGALVDNGLVEANGGTLAVDLSGSGTLAIDPGAALAIAGAATGVTVAFNGVGTLDLSDPAGFAGTIANLGTDSVLSLTGVSITSGTIKADRLVLTESGGGSLTYALASPSPALTNVTLVPTSSGDTILFKSNTEDFASDEIVQLSGSGTLARSGNDVTIDLGNVRQNATSPGVELGVANTQPSGADTLAGSFTTAVASPYAASGFAAFTNVAGGSTIDAGSIGLATSGAGGIVSAHVTLAGTSEGATTTPLAADVATVTGTLYDEADPTLASSTIAVAARVAAGGTLVGATELSNGPASVPYTENLDYQVNSVASPFSLDAAVASSGTLASGNGTPLSFDIGTGSAGAFSTTIGLGLATDGNGVDGLGTLALPSQSVSLTADIFGTAQVGGFGTITLPDIVHPGAVTAYATITNPSFYTLQDDLTGSLGSVSGLSAESGSFDAPAGSSSVLGFALDTGTTGSNVATAAYNLASTDTPLGSETLSAPGTLAFDYTVQNYATAALSEANGGAGTLTPTGIANNYVLDFGTIVSGSPDVTGTINVGNAAMGVADWLDGTLVSSGSTFDFTNDTNSVSHLLAGQSPDILGAITFDPTTDGNYAETLVLQPYSGNADGDTARPDVYLTVEAKVVAQSSGGSVGVSTHGHTTAGYTTHGHTTTGYTTTGYTTSGHTTSGHTTSGHTTSGHTTSGHTTSGHTTSGHSSGGHSSGGHSSGGHSSGGHSSGGHSSGGHSSGGHSSGGHSSGGHSSGGESTGGHSSGGHSSGGHSSGGHSSGGQSSGGNSSGSQSSGGQSSGGQSSGGGYTTGGGEGDTHLLTFNGSRYDFQAAGEFVLVKNKDIQVQIRLEPAGGAADPTGSVSYITQTAIGVGRERITIDFTRATALYVNGAPVSLMAGQFLKLPGVTIYDEGNDYLVKAATGEKVMVGNEVTTVALNGAGGSPVGLLGSWTESKADTFTLPDGKVLSSPLSFADLYQTFANAWRVTTATSLFDYPTDPTTGDPENTNSPQITNLDFPATPVTVSDLPASVVQQAQQVVTGLGITDPSQQQNAILDYVLSGGNLAVVSSDLSAQQQGQTGGAPAAITNPPPPVYAGIIPPEGSVTVNGTAEFAAFQVYRTGDTSTALTLNYAVEAPGNSNYVTSAEYGGVLASGTITIAAGQTAATLDIATPGTLVLPSEELLVGISTSASGVDLVSTSAQAALVTTLPVRGIDAVPDFYATSALGAVSTAGSITTYSIGTIGADGIGTIDAGLGNETPNYGNALGGTLAVGSGDGFDIIGLGTIDLAPGGSDNIGVDPGVTTLGTHTETLELSPASFNSSGYTGTLAPEYFVVTDTVVDPTAMPSVLPATETLIGRVNENFSTAVTITNNAVIGSDDLDVTLTDTGGDVVVGSSSPLAPGASTALALNEAPGLAAGTFSDTLDVGYVSHDPNSGGHADVTLPGTTVTLDGTVYAQAVASLGTKVIDFGTVHEGAADPLMSLTVTNTASGTLADDLIATTAKAGGIFTATGSLDLAAGAAGTLEYGLNTAVGGSFTSTALVTVSSHDDAQADLALGTRAVRLEGTVISDAAPGYVEVSGPGAIVAVRPTLETLNLGTLVEGTAAALSVAIANTATGLADTLSGTLEFVSSGSTIDLGTISGISAGSTSDAFGFTFDAATMGADTGTLVFDGESIGSAGTIALAPDLLDITATVVCFCPGTRIATPDGERAVEELAAGDLVLTAAGIARPVRWLGRQTVATRFADPFRVAPIRIRAGALGDNVPVRDLLVSPDHALMVDSVFVQAGALVNGVSITREDADMPERLIYFHVELADHALILAEGVEAETFIDNVDRLAFDNWDEHQALGDDTAPMREMAHSRAKAHRQVPKALRAWLVARGVALYGRDVAGVA